MRICLIQAALPFHVAGGGPSLGWNTARNLVERGHEVVLLTTSTAEWRGAQTIEGVDVRFLEDVRFGWGYAIGQQFTSVAVDRYLRQHTAFFDVAQVRGWLHAGFAGLICRRHPLPLPILGQTHGLGMVHQLLTPLRLAAHDETKTPLERAGAMTRHTRKYGSQYFRVERAVRHLGGFAAVSQSALNTARHLYRIPTRRLHVVHDGVSMDRFHPPVVEPTGKVVLFVGQLSRLKGIEVLLRAAAHVLAVEPDAEFRIVGDGPEKARFVALASELRIDRRVKFLGWLDSAGVAEEMRRCHIFANPSLHRGGYETVQIEAMACGRVVVSPDAGSNRTLITPDISGLMFRQSSVRSLARTVVKALRLDGHASRTMAENARRRVVEEFSISAMGRMTEEALQRVIGEKKR